MPGVSLRGPPPEFEICPPCRGIPKRAHKSLIQIQAVERSATLPLGPAPARATTFNPRSKPHPSAEPCPALSPPANPNPRNRGEIRLGSKQRRAQAGETPAHRRRLKTSRPSAL